MDKVVKFGGSSVADSEQFRKAAGIITKDPKRKYVVVSAPGRRFDGDDKVTDLLYRLYDEISGGREYEFTLDRIRERYREIADGLGLKTDLNTEFGRIAGDIREGAGRDYAASRGEYLCAKLMAEHLGRQFVDAKDVIRFRDGGQLDFDATLELLSERLAGCEGAVVPGFYGSDASGRIVTFSRGGSDVTGSLIARAIMAEEYENWTDVSGFMIADPRVVKDPKVIETITYAELRELAYMGATVLHEDAIFPVRREGIPIHILNTNHPEDAGTLIVESTCRIPKYTITGIAGKKGFCSITVDKAMMNSEIGFCMKVLEVFSENDISIEHMPSGIDTMSVFVHQSEFEEKEQNVIAGIHRAVQPDFVEMEPGIALIAVVGRAMKSNRGTAGRIFSALAHAGVNIKMIDQGSSESNIIIGVRDSDFEAAIRAIYDIYVTAAL